MSELKATRIVASVACAGFLLLFVIALTGITEERAKTDRLRAQVEALTRACKEGR